MPALNKLGMHAPLYVVHRFTLNADLVDTILFASDGYYELVEARERHGTAGSDGGGLTAQLEKLNAGEAIGAAGADNLLATTFNLQSTTNTDVSRTVGNGGITQTEGNRQLAPGDAIALNVTGVTTAYANGVIVLVLKRIRIDGNEQR